MFYGTLKVLKLQQQHYKQSLEELTMRPIISNIGTAIHEIDEYLNKLLTPLTKGECTILNTEELIRRLRKETIPVADKMVSFNVKTLFTYVPLDETIEIF